MDGCFLTHWTERRAASFVGSRLIFPNFFQFVMHQPITMLAQNSTTTSATVVDRLIIVFVLFFPAPNIKKNEFNRINCATDIPKYVQHWRWCSEGVKLSPYSLSLLCQTGCTWDLCFFFLEMSVGWGQDLHHWVHFPSTLESPIKTLQKFVCPSRPA